MTGRGLPPAVCYGKVALNVRWFNRAAALSSLDNSALAHRGSLAPGALIPTRYRLRYGFFSQETVSKKVFQGKKNELSIVFAILKGADRPIPETVTKNALSAFRICHSV